MKKKRRFRTNSVQQRVWHTICARRKFMTVISCNKLFLLSIRCLLANHPPTTPTTHTIMMSTGGGCWFVFAGGKNMNTLIRMNSGRSWWPKYRPCSPPLRMWNCPRENMLHFRSTPLQTFPSMTRGEGVYSLFSFRLPAVRAWCDCEAA